MAVYILIEEWRVGNILGNASVFCSFMEASCFFLRRHNFTFKNFAQENCENIFKPAQKMDKNEQKVNHEFFHLAHTNLKI